MTRSLKFNEFAKRATKAINVGVRAVKKVAKNDHVKKFMGDIASPLKDTLTSDDPKASLPTLGKKIAQSGFQNAANALNDTM